jgi:hypothetical protein
MSATPIDHMPPSVGGCAQTSGKIPLIPRSANWIPSPPHKFTPCELAPPVICYARPKSKGVAVCFLQPRTHCLIDSRDYRRLSIRLVALRHNASLDSDLKLIAPQRNPVKYLLRVLVESNRADMVQIS